MNKLKLKIQRSKWLTGLLLLIHLGAIFCVLFLNFPIWLVALLIILISYSCYTSLRPSNGILEVSGLRNDTFISQYLIILNFDKRKRLVVICPDSADKQSLRALRRLLMML
jgi:hypothetical protein